MLFFSGLFDIRDLVEHTKSSNCISRKKIRGVKPHFTQENTFPKHLVDENTTLQVCQTSNHISTPNNLYTHVLRYIHVNRESVLD